MFDFTVGKNHIMLLVVALLLTISVDFARSAQTKAKTKAKSDYLNLIILHNNDMHSKFKAKDGKYGFARTSYVIKRHRKAALEPGGTPVIYLNAGDNYVGSRWFNLFKAEVVTAFMNVLKPDAVCLGNHEFDHKVEALLPYLKAAKYPVLFANFKKKKDDPLLNANVKKSTVLIVKGYRIGIIGYLTSETGRDIDYTDEVTAVNKEADNLSKKGVKTIFALGHSGFAKDLEVAEKCPKIDLVIGGHTHTLLHAGVQPGEEEINGPYPTNVTQKGGKIVPVVQVYWAAKYLGKLKVRINKTTGRLKVLNGNSIQMISNIPEDPEILALEKIYQKKEEEYAGPPIAISELEFDHFRCRILECVLGNMITDSFVEAAKAELDDASFTPTAAIITSGNIRAQLLAGNITQLDLEDVLPFESVLVIMKITGKKLMQAFEHSVAKFVEQEFVAAFLQVSGFKVVFDVALKSGNRVLSVEIRNSKNKYEKLDLHKVYNVVTSKYLIKNADGFSMLKDCEAKILPIKILDAFTKYVKRKGVLNPSPVHEGRITVHNVFQLKKGVPPLHDYL